MAGLPPRVALETTLLAHGVPAGEGLPLARELASLVREAGAEPAIVGIAAGRAVCGLSEEQLAEMLDSAAGGASGREGAGAPAPGGVPKVNAANLGLALHSGGMGATTVSATMEIAAGAGVRLFATGGLGGVHRGVAPPDARPSARLDVSSDLFALTRFPVAVVCSGVKSILDVAATREVLEMLGVPVVGFGTDRFPAFYQRAVDDRVRVDARFDDVSGLARYVDAELTRSGRAVVVCNPVPVEHEIDAATWARWLGQAETRVKAAGAAGRDVTPLVLGALHEISGGKTLRTNIALVKSNTRLAARLAVAIAG